MEDMLCGGGSRVCPKCSKTTFGSEIHYCGEESVGRRDRSFDGNLDPDEIDALWQGIEIPTEDDIFYKVINESDTARKNKKDFLDKVISDAYAMPFNEEEIDSLLKPAEEDKEVSEILDRKYIILSVEDVKYITNFLPEGIIKAKFKQETGADIREIAYNLKHTPICGACRIECQQHNCESLNAQKLGRRLQRLIDRADATSIQDII